MDSLFAPWRYAYLVQEKTDPGCVFCRAARGDGGDADLVVYRGRLNYVILNLYPYNNGHLMVVPYDHVAAPSASTEAQRAEMAELAVAAELVLREVYKPDGFNFGMNLGRAAGAGIEAHYHLHAVPRWSGDTNFMAVTAGTRVIPEDLRSTRDQVRRGFLDRLGADGGARAGAAAASGGDRP
jgi:ATP adenylyltransferase